MNMISIIIPVYNAEKHLSRCLDSILHQTYRNWELIIVDDGSSDGSSIIYNKYSEIDSRIKIIKQENKGANKARQEGWRAATGEWITFVDADDFIPNNAIKSLADMITDKSDIIIGWTSNFKTNENSINIEEYRNRCIGCYKIEVGPYAHLFRKTLYSDSIFDLPRELKVGEDDLMNIRLSYRTFKPIYFVHEMVYFYDMTNENSIIHKHKGSFDYEYLFHQYRILSIPPEQHLKYINATISIRFYQLLKLIKEKPFDNKWKKHKFTTDLISDIKSQNYTISKSIKLLLNSNNLFVQWLWIIYSNLIKFYK